MSRRSLLTGALLFLSGLAGFAVGRAQETPAGKAAPPGKSAAASKAPAPAGELKTIEDQAAYAIGLNIARQISSGEAKLNPDVVMKGINDGLKKNKPLLSDEQIDEVMVAFSKKMQAAAEAKLKPAAEKNAKDGAAFLAANKEKPGVKSTESGLQYEVVKKGTGASPKATDMVKVHYHGTLTNGEVFDSSVKRGEPATFGVNQVIPGWTEALQLMKVGDKWKIYLPSKLAYGARGTPDGTIGPNQVLVFDVELLDIVK